MKDEDKKSRLDKQINIDKIAAYIVANPLSTVREIAEATGISKSTVAEHIKSDEVGQKGIKDDRIVSLTDGDYEIMEAIQKIKKERLTVEPEKVSNGDIDKRENTATKRYSLFVWDATNPDWWLKETALNTNQETALDKVLSYLWKTNGD